MDYITTKEAAKNWGITDRMVVYHCSAGRIKEGKKREIHGLFPLPLKNRLTDDIEAVRKRMVKINETDIFG
jgi:predicted urease superfamily metal-dependent hydrolase